MKQLCVSRIARDYCGDCTHVCLLVAHCRVTWEVIPLPLVAIYPALISSKMAGGAGLRLLLWLDDHKAVLFPFDVMEAFARKTFYLPVVWVMFLLSSAQAGGQRGNRGRRFQLQQVASPAMPHGEKGCMTHEICHSTHR